MAGWHAEMGITGIPSVGWAGYRGKKIDGIYAFLSCHTRTGSHQICTFHGQNISHWIRRLGFALEPQQNRRFMAKAKGREALMGRTPVHTVLACVCLVRDASEHLGFWVAQTLGAKELLHYAWISPFLPCLPEIVIICHFGYLFSFCSYFLR